MLILIQLTKRRLVGDPFAVLCHSILLSTSTRSKPPPQRIRSLAFEPLNVKIKSLPAPPEDVRRAVLPDHLSGSV
jgi:hypothetical protein